MCWFLQATRFFLSLIFLGRVMDSEKGKTFHFMMRWWTNIKIPKEPGKSLFLPEIDAFTSCREDKKSLLCVKTCLEDLWDCATSLEPTLARIHGRDNEKKLCFSSFVWLWENPSMWVTTIHSLASSWWEGWADAGTSFQVRLKRFILIFLY